ncbi:serine/threonine-protein phosphatase 4 regulatory subunit 4 isoform X8 [Hydra vulgaris]|uniref:Serine/threonine-protein phosphatase 4 regulatory subunit 4 isoform X8 n=2 Tax=Hydra vulgaris TaxID=6087 RepID=A0ABM4C491_HYDVU
MAWEDAFHQQIIELSLSENVENLRDERTIKHNKVTKEEIERLTVDENLKPTQRVIYILKNGQDIQKISTIDSLDVILKDEPPDCYKDILPLIKDAMIIRLREIQIAGATVLWRLLKKHLLDSKKFFTIFLDHILAELLSWDIDVCDAWLETIVYLLHLLKQQNDHSLTILESKLIDFLVKNCSLHQSPAIRKVCCKIVGSLAAVVSKKRLLSDLMPKLKSLCQDIDLDVRARMCIELGTMIQILENDLSKQHLFPELYMLIDDEEATVRQAAFTTITNLLTNLSQDLQDSLKKVVLKFVAKALVRKHGDELISLAELFGRNFLALSGFLTEEERCSLLSCYQMLCFHGNNLGTVSTISPNLVMNEIVPLEMEDKRAQCRYWCTVNLPIILSCGNKNAFQACLLPCLISLSKDPSVLVRRTTAMSLYEIAKHLSDDTYLMHACIADIIKDSSIYVLDGFLLIMPSIFEALQTSGGKNFIPELIPQLLESEDRISSSLHWRIYEHYLEAISCLHFYQTSDQIMTKIVPNLLKVLTANKVRPVMLAAGQCLLTLLKHNGNIRDREEICEKLINLLARSEHCKYRILFMNLYPYIAELFSRRFFKCMFYDVAMQMALDPIINVRLKFCTTLPLLKSLLCLPLDRMLLQTLELTVRRIMALENDKDVLDAIKNVIEELDTVRVCLDLANPSEADIKDLEKEKFEDSVTEEFQIEKKSRTVSLGTKDSVKKVTSKGTRSSSSVVLMRKIGVKDKEVTSKVAAPASVKTSKKSSVSSSSSSAPSSSRK